MSRQQPDKYVWKLVGYLFLYNSLQSAGLRSGMRWSADDQTESTRTDGTVVDAAEPRVVLTDDVPSLCREITSHRRLVTVASHPRRSRYNRVSTADRYTPQHTTTKFHFWLGKGPRALQMFFFFAKSGALERSSP